jgi:hypothetical protein
MFEKHTLLVLGAGASVDLGLPLGSKLILEIARLLDFRLPDRGDLADALAAQALGDRNEISNLRRAAVRIADGAPFVSSIDTFLDMHQDDERMVRCGKIAIVYAILASERKSALYRNPRAHPQPPFPALQDTWLPKFVRALTTGCAKTHLANLFSRLTVINFNYDRCFEIYLAGALAAVYSISDEEAQALIDERLEIIHPYGTVGPLPWHADAIGFGSSLDPRVLPGLADRIRTFTERIQDSDMIYKMKALVLRSQQIVFLGFGFHRQNMELLKVSGPGNQWFVYATAHGISPSDQKVVDGRIRGMLDEGFYGAFNLHNGTCTDLFDHYALTLVS